MGRCGFGHGGPGGERGPVLAVALVLFLAWSGCGGDDDGGTAPAVPSGTVIDAGGGSVSSADGNATLAVPAGALQQEVRFTVEPVDPAPAEPLAGTAFRFEPDGTMFSQPAAIGIAYDPAVLGGGVFAADLRLARQQGGSWLPLAGSTVDSTAHMVYGSTDHLSSYGIVTTTAPAPGDSFVVTLKDDPAAGSPVEFGTLAEAMAALSDSLEAGQLGVIRWWTDTPQVVQQLAFSFDLRVEPGDGYSPVLQGPAGQPLVVDAAGALDLSGFSIEAPGGLVLNANRHLALAGSRLPASTLVLVGGVKGAPCPAAEPAFTAESADVGGRATGIAIDNCRLGDDFRLNLGESSSLMGNYSISASDGATVGVFGNATLAAGSDLDFLDNVLDVLDVNVRAQADASFNLQGNTGLDNLTFSADLTGSHDLTFQGNVAAAADIKLAGVGSATLTLRNENIVDNQWRLGLSGVVLDGQGLDLTNLAIIGIAVAVDPDIGLDLLTSSVAGNLQIDLMDSEAGKLTLSLDHVSLHDVAVTAKYEVEHNFDEVTVSGHAQFTLNGDLVDWEQSHSSYDLGVSVNAGGVSGALTIRSQNDAFSGPVEFITSPSVNASITITNGFLDGGRMFIGEEEKGRAGSAPVGRGGVLLDHFTWQGSGYDMVEITGAVGTVTVRDCAFTNAAAPGAVLSLVEVNGAVTIENSQFNGGGISAVDCPGSFTIADNAVTISSGSALALSMGTCGSTSITGNSITYSGSVAVGISEMSGSVTLTDNSIDAGSASICCLFGNSNVTLDDNSLISGTVQVILGSLHVSGNTFENARVIDPGLPPALQNDPVEDNDGLSPDDCLTHMDWDGNGCCDYPPAANQMDEQGNCACDGVAG